MRLFCTSLACIFIVGAFADTTAAQTFDPSWYDASSTYVKIGVVTDGVYEVTGSELTAAGVAISTIDPTNLQLFDRGEEVPIRVNASGASLQSGDSFTFPGQRNTGEDELWLFDNDASRRNSSYHSLFTDTTYYWLRWDNGAGLRYSPAPVGGTSTATISRVSRTARVENESVYFPGNGSSAGNPIYSKGEGYYHQSIRHNTSQNILTVNRVIPLPGSTGLISDSVHVSILLASETVSRHIVTLSVRTSGGTYVELSTADWIGVDSRTLTATLAQSALANPGEVDLQLTSFNDFGSATPNNLFIDWFNVDYDSSIQPDNGYQHFEVSGTGETDLVMTGISSSGILYDTTSEDFYAVNSVAGNATVTVNLQGTHRFVYVDDNANKSSVDIHLDQSSDLASSANAADYVVVATASTIASAQNLVQYRASSAGGGYSTMLVLIDDIFDQFDYGRPTPVAIRRFVRSSQGWANPAQFMTIWGDALYPLKSRPRNEWEIPSFGHTASDGWYAMQNASLTDYSESIAIGRLPIRNNEQGNIFVDKVTDYESGTLDLWQKNAMYLVGGVTDSERFRLQSSALLWSAEAAARPVHMDTLHFFKTSSNVLDPTFKDSLQAAFVDGSSWLTYFGHSATQTWEIVTDPPAEYNNAGRLPIVLSLGCFTGDFATGDGSGTDILSFSEQLVIQSQNGSIAHWGASASGTISASARLGDEVHQSVFSDTLRVLGEAFRVAKSRVNDQLSDPNTVKHLLQYGLIGDPATRIALPDRPELRLRQSQLLVTPLAPTPSDLEVNVAIDLQNVGLAVDSLDVTVRHVNPDGTDAKILSHRTPPFRIRTTENFKLQLLDTSIGENQIVVTVDPANEYEEVDELNNIATQNFTVFSSGLAIVEPYDFALFPTTDVSLKVSVATTSNDEIPVLFELDTDSQFQSGTKQTFSVTTTGGAAEWTPAGLVNAQTYFWRARVDDPSQSDVWNNGSFTIRTDLNRTGWYQSGQQFESTSTDDLVNWEDSIWVHNTYSLDVSASSERGSGLDKGQFVVGSEIYERLGLGFGLLIMDATEGAVKASGSMPTYANSFEDPVLAFQELDSLAGLITTGDYYFIRTRHLGNSSGETTIPDSIKAIFQDLGSTAIDTLTYQDLWIAKGRLGFPEEFEEFVDPAGGTNEITIPFTATFTFQEGVVDSRRVGPARTWQLASYEQELPNPNASIRFEVLTDDLSTVIQSVTNPTEIDLSAIDAKSNPFLRLRATITDSSHLATPQLLSWHVAFEPIADLAIDPTSFVLSSDSLLVGEPLDVAFRARNLSNISADSMIVDVYIVDTGNESMLVASDTLVAFSGSQDFSYTFETNDLIGDNSVRVDVRQPGLAEPVRINNIAVRTFVVLSDATPPEFTVRVDGDPLPHDPNPVINLQDPALAFVSLNPTIEIEIVDNNQFISLLNDSSIVQVTLDDERIPYSDLVFSDTTRSADPTRLFVSYVPDLSGSDSTHTLQVEVEDGSGNEAVGSPYQTHFRTQNALEVESVYPYPNPMSTFTNFAFQVRGATADDIDRMRLRIFTINGALVREFNLTEDPSALASGALRVGWNKLWWDGTDQDGDRVATGVYLYKVYLESGDGEVNLSKGSDVEKVVVIR